MLAFMLRRFIYMVVTLFLVSILSFAIIQLPPGDYLSSMVAGMSAEGQQVDQQFINAMRDRYGLGDPVYVQYWKWISGIVLRGDFGQSFEWNRPVSSLIYERMGLTLLLSVATLFFIWAVAFPIGIYSAIRKNSFGAHLATLVGFIGLAIPNFLIALVFMYLSFRYFGQSVGGLFSPQYENASWSLAKVGDLIAHMWIPIIVLGTAGTATLIRIMRANLLDELNKPYVTTARAMGHPEHVVLLKYPVRVALNPFVSTVGWVLPGLVSGATITAIVLNLPMSGPMLLRSLLTQDMYLAGSFILLLSTLTVIGTLISDILLAWLDPRIRYS
ncbi:ABC transporter permease [Devosia nitrariae]|uniref:ABC transporter permease n=1 Tax=Devosia nitrariae TaxID=2071872 RepID=A0ABQ5W5N3_9HYPH|nr:ABC transporter permease [Devosia nitrariae]GLQ55173.1 ABC transporter permease [Devosia nitrariae]